MKTRKPCPGCGEVDSYRKADAVCSACAHAIKSWNGYAARLNAKKEYETVKLKSAHHWYPQFYFGGPRCHVPELREVRDSLSRLFEELGRLIPVEIFEWRDRPASMKQGQDCAFLYEKPRVDLPKKPGENYARPADYPCSDSNPDSHSLYAKIEPALLKVVRELWDNTARFADLAYQGGRTDGRNLLIQLSNGEITSQELQEEDVELARKVQNASYLHKKLRRPAPKAVSQ